jgi:hypothetical protein
VLGFRKGEQDEAAENAGKAWQGTRLIFTTRYGTPIEPRNFSRSYDNQITKAGVRRMSRIRRESSGPWQTLDMTSRASFVRYQARDVDDRGRFLGIFMLVNGLAKQGRLTAEQEHFRRTNNDWYDAAYRNPTTVDPTVYDRTRNPGAAAWFKSSAQHLLVRIDGYLTILNDHDVPWVHLEIPTPPGRVVYEDDHQVVVAPTRKAAGATGTQQRSKQPLPCRSCWPGPVMAPTSRRCAGQWPGS